MTDKEMHEWARDLAIKLQQTSQVLWVETIAGRLGYLLQPEAARMRSEKRLREVAGIVRFD